MTYNLHPIFVHFPIALLFLYSVIKIIPLKKWFPSLAWRDIERLLLLVGVLGAFTAMVTGNIAMNIVHPEQKLVDTHATFAFLTTLLYVLLLAGEISAVIRAKEYFKNSKAVVAVASFLEKVFCHPVFSAIIALVALVTISITGLLGGVMVYGLSADPLAPLMLKMLGIDY